MDFIIAKYNYWIYIILMMIGLYGMIAKNNLAKKVVGMTLFQTSIILFFISTSVKSGGATVPIVMGDPHLHGHVIPGTVHAIQYLNPLPHVLMLTAIVVMVATFGIAVALLMRIYKRYGTLEGDEIVEIRKQETAS
ncbi:MAG: cation:proton antiporter subunit C [Desulfobacteraceae bacterium]|nr:cation:proton antiporter subunit C [Desulfobacteraceae bacterium]MBC2718807.1 cation:proton antiporter subunit C [Desulfobacteraceae bacterium]